MDEQSNSLTTPENAEESAENMSVEATDSVNTEISAHDDAASVAQEPAETTDAASEETVAEDVAVEEAPVEETAAEEDAAQEAVAAETPAEASVEATAEEADKPADEEAGKPVDPVAALANPFDLPVAPGGLLFHAPDLSVLPPLPSRAPQSANDDDDEDFEPRAPRSRRRSRGSSNRGSAAKDNAVEGNADPQAFDGTDSDENETDEPSSNVTLRRRRRRRRGDADIELEGGSQDDPPNTVTRVRAARSAADSSTSQRVTAVKGSTRLEAKRQRRRESREVGRRRHVITEAEFLARRESVDRQMMVRQNEDRIQIAVLEDGVLAEHFVSKTQQDSLIGSVYVGKVQNVLPSMEAAFVDIGRGRNAVLYAGEVNWDVAGLDGQPRRIEHALKSGDTVLVQVTKDPVGHKGARLTAQISLPGRYLVFVPGGSMTGISRKLPDVERSRLKKILKDHLPENAGVIVRTAAEGASEEELMNDINRLRAQWEEIEAKSKSTKTLAPELLYGEPDLTIKVVRDVFNEDFSKLVIQGEEAWDTIEAYVTYVAPDLVSRLEKWDGDKDIFAKHRIDEQISKALERKVFLPSGGSLVIDRTEAMTVVDVNTGKFVGSGGNLEETVTKNNLEAAEEIVRQLRLRDIGGIIVIDFIDMVLESNRDLVLRRLVECLGRDRTKHQVAEVTSLGLVQMTRKRMGTGLLEVFSENCEACAGRGVITYDEPVEHRHHSSQDQVNNSSSRPSRAERRRRSREKDSTTEPAKNNATQSAPAESASNKPATEQVEAEDPEKTARAQAARKALASIAAATHAAHEHEGEESPAEEAQEAPAAAEAPRFTRTSRRGRSRAAARDVAKAIEVLAERGEDRNADSEETEDALESVVVHGEKIALPSRRRKRRVASVPAQTPQLTLDALAAALDAVTSAHQDDAENKAEDRAKDDAAAPAERASSVTPEPAKNPVPAAETPALGKVSAPVTPVVAENSGDSAVRKPRRRRVASSQQGAGDTEIRRHDGELTAQGSSFTASVASVGKDASPEAQSGPQPQVLGTGVPASELAK
ncbi:Rne/Rng family ribonuclease [Neomicrococcus lactis]|uniref:Rne/Rng family ribonuclease n=1 Tax=Neomicrococcus lactis TaxID=732241 RepID=UPI002300343A|nr:Rne/Rng family ribonuclease [Neomicrococcus lactis]